jgi:hypothetical protein
MSFLPIPRTGEEISVIALNLGGADLQVCGKALKLCHVERRAS